MAHEVPNAAAVEAMARQAMASTGARGLAIAVIDDGQVASVGAWGERNEAGDPLTTDTVMYGASLTKAVFGYLVAQLEEEGALGLDQSIADMLPRPLTDYHTPDIVNRYADWSALDERWRQITPRIALTHSTGFANFGFTEPDEKLHFHFDPGARFAYSGDGLITLQFALEEGLGLDVGAEAQRRIFDRFGMTNTSLIWRPDFGVNLADGWDAEGAVEPHDERSRVRAAGSMDTTISDFASFAAAYVRGDGLSAASRAGLTRPLLPITTHSQFLTFQSELPVEQRRADLAAGLGVVVFGGPQGHGFFKGGHNNTTANTWLCVEATRDCVVILSNDVRAEPAFAGLVQAILGDTGAPYDWEYGFTPNAPQ
ncbi:serine hydrolase [Brevundimonas sp. Leaf363]|uniref:serine hydrolase domain-containing protein n=1 Tax=Brevundimonas sp. Leaf363 TaxID=1736353 RepID=UPI001F15D545|nr:serine hydrolase domain-containing protein [Brevundimonas sp. Leaf363]